MTEGAKKQLILVVDDEVNTVTLLHDVLSLKGYDVIKAYDGLECLDAAQKSHPDAILLDINMPNLDGWQTCERLKAAADTKSIPVILLSAFAQKQDKDRGMSLGASDYLTKPVNLAQLVQRLQELIPKT